jgi:hypothetical protein
MQHTKAKKQDAANTDRRTLVFGRTSRVIDIAMLMRDVLFSAHKLTGWTQGKSNRSPDNQRESNG